MMVSTASIISAALLIFRLVVGLGVAVHGAQKIFGWFGSPGRAATAQGFESLGFRPGLFFSVGAGLGELAGGLLSALGLFGALGPALIMMVMVVAILVVHVKNGFLTMNNGWELPGLYAVSALLLAFIGFGSFSVDQALGFTLLSTTKTAAVLLGGGVVLALLNVGLRRPLVSSVPTSTQ